MKSSVEFEKLSPQSGIVRWGGWVESRDHMELRDDGENRGSSEGRQTKGIERVEDGVDGRQTKGFEAMEDGVEGCQARKNEEIDGV